MRKVRKITDKQFLAILRDNGGLFARTAAAIEIQFNVPYSRQAARKRAEKFPDVIFDIEQEMVDLAEEGLHTLMRSGDERVRLKACELYLKTKGKMRGYVERNETDVSYRSTELILPMLDG